AIRRDPVARPQEAHEEPQHVRIRVDQRDVVSTLASLRPEEHAAGLVKRVAAECDGSSLELRDEPLDPGVLTALALPPLLPLEAMVASGERCDLLRRQLDVARPQAYGADR